MNIVAKDFILNQTNILIQTSKLIHIQIKYLFEPSTGYDKGNVAEGISDVIITLGGRGLEPPQL